MTDLAAELEKLAESIDDRVCEMSGEPPADYLRARAAESTLLRAAASALRGESETEKLRRELVDIARLREPFEQDMDRFQRASKKLGSNAERALNDALSRIRAGFEWAREAAGLPLPPPPPPGGKG